MEIKQLEYFQAVAKLEHYTHAAEQLSLSQPALSRSIANLEDELSVPLFDHEGRSVRLNQFGMIFLRRVNAALHEIEEAKREIKDSLDPELGTVSLAFLPTLGSYLVPELVRTFHEQHPHINFQLSQNASSVIINDLKNGSVDLCLSFPPVNDRNITWTRLMNEELYVVVPQHHRLAARTSVTLSEVENDLFILLKHGYGLRSSTERFCKEAGFVPKIMFEGDDVTTVIGFVEAGLGIALIPYIPNINMQKVKLLSVRKPKCDRIIALTWMKDRYMSAAAAEFKNFVLSYLTEDIRQAD